VKISVGQDSLVPWSSRDSCATRACSETSSLFNVPVCAAPVKRLSAFFPFFCVFGTSSANREVLLPEKKSRRYVTARQEAVLEEARMSGVETCIPAKSVGSRVRLLYVLIAVLTLTQSGCLLALAGVAGGAAATGYFYYKGRVYRDFPASFPEVYNAVRAALLDLNFVIFSDEPKDGKACIVTKTTNGKKVRIYLDCLHSPIPAEGLLTRVSIRVACFGDEAVSARIFNQIAFRLSHPAPAASAQPAPPPVQQTGFQTSEPKLAPAEKAGSRP